MVPIVLSLGIDLPPSFIESETDFPDIFLEKINGLHFWLKDELEFILSLYISDSKDGQFLF